MASGDDPNNQKKPLRNNDLEGLGMDELLNLYEKSNIAEGEIVRGRVVKLTPSDVAVESEGLLPIGEVTGHDGKPRVKPGDDIEVFVERLEDPSGYVILSREKAARMRIWDEIEAAYKTDQPISGRDLVPDPHA